MVYDSNPKPIIGLCRCDVNIFIGSDNINYTRFIAGCHVSIDYISDKSRHLLCDCKNIRNSEKHPGREGNSVTNARLPN